MENKKYHLAIPNTYFRGQNCLNVNIETGFYIIAPYEQTEGWQTEFTLEEIENLPEQDFINTLDRIEVIE